MSSSARKTEKDRYLSMSGMLSNRGIIRPLYVIFLVAVLLTAFPSFAYVPPEWQDAVTNDVRLYQVSNHFSNESWTQDNLNYLVRKYTNRPRISPRALHELGLKMNWYADKFNIKEPSYIPYCNDCLKTIP